MIKFFWTCLDIAAVVLLLVTIISFLSDHCYISMENIHLPMLMQFLFIYSYLNIFVLAGVGLINIFLRKNFKRSLFYIGRSAIFLFFFMGLSDWDRF